ncbi:MAG: adenylosuccinate lyase [Myxococcales bacterium]|nr:adenylosuccinate lyase [Myxococcales bacterium]
MHPRYSRPEMTALWTDAARMQRWLAVELAHLGALEQLGLAPAGSAATIAAQVVLDPARADAIERTVKHDVIAFLTMVEESAGPSARLLHRGLTSSDVLDTALAQTLVAAGILLQDGLAALIQATMDVSARHRATPTIGRSHGMFAEPTTFGVVLASHVAEFTRCRKRLRAAVAEIAVGKLAGAVGVYGQTPPEAESLALAALGLRAETAATQVVPRDRHAVFFAALGWTATAVERFAVNMRHLHRSEVGEVREAFTAGQKGSSAMPHKRNPILAENLCGLARLVRGYARIAEDDVALWHERDISHSSVERVIGPDATVTLDFLLHRATGLVRSLEVDAGRMRAHLDAAGGAFFTGTVLNALVDAGVGRQDAYTWVQRAGLAALDGAGALLTLLERDPDVCAKLGLDGLRRCFDLDHALRHCGLVVDRACMAATDELASCEGTK